MSSNLWNKKLNCPFCNSEFETTRLRSSAMKVKERMSDFGNIYQDECPYFYAITACPQCTFAARNDDFEGIRPEYEAKVMEASKKLRLPGVVKPDIFTPGPLSAEVAAKRHELAIAFMRMRFHVDLGEIAGLLMHLVWIYRLSGAKEKEREHMRQALKAYEEYFEKGGKLPERLGEPGILFLIGELHRRLEEFRDARRYFERALASKEIKAFPNIENVTRDTMLQVKEQMENQGK